MACHKFAIALALAQALPYVAANSRLEGRQSDPENVSTYLLEVNAARYDIAMTQAGNETAACDNSDSTYGGQPYDAALAKILLCETVVGVNVFPDLASAANNFSFAYVALQNRAKGLSNFLDCPDAHLDLETFGAAGINGTALESVICYALASASSTPLSTTAALPSTMSKNLSTTVEASTSLISTDTVMSSSLTASAISSSIATASVSSTSTSTPGSSVAASTSEVSGSSALATTSTSFEMGTTDTSTSIGSTPFTSMPVNTANSPAVPSASSVSTTSIVSSTPLLSVTISSSTKLLSSTTAVENSTTASTLGPSVIVGPPVSVIITSSTSMALTSPSPSILAVITPSRNSSTYAGTVTMLNTLWIFVDPANATLDTSSTEFGTATGTLIAIGTGACL